MNDNIREKLIELKENHGLCAVKGGTEVEDMTFKELSLLRKISKNICPMIVKIGGAEARNDMRFLVSAGIDGILGPMIESEYALRNYIQTLKNLDFIDKFSVVAINIETITAADNLVAMKNTDEFKSLTQITVGRGDLSMSMGLTVDHPQVIARTKWIVDIAKNNGLATSVGGGITPENAHNLVNTISTKRVNTRHIGIDTGRTRNISQSIIAALEFEIHLYKEFMKIEPDKTSAYKNRIATTRRRLTSLPAVNA